MGPMVPMLPHATRRSDAAECEGCQSNCLSTAQFRSGETRTVVDEPAAVPNRPSADGPGFGTKRSQYTRLDESTRARVLGPEPAPN